VAAQGKPATPPAADTTSASTTASAEAPEVQDDAATHSTEPDATKNAG
jgi:hypothetical protein